MIVIGASAGGVEALMTLVAGFGPRLAAAVAVVLHIRPDAESVLPQILSRRGVLPAKHAVDGERWQAGTIYVAPPDHHLVVSGERFRLTRGPRVNGHRPAVDPLFRSAATQLGPRAIGVVLSGALDDGTAGMMAIERAGGVTIVQAPDDALHPAMPTNVLEHVRVDHTARVEQLAATLMRLAGQQIVEPQPAEASALEPQDEEATLGPPTMFTCPDCGGALWERDDGGALAYRCHVGHAWASETLANHQDQRLEDALWLAYRTLEENASFSKRLAERAARRGFEVIANRYWTRYREAKKRSELLRAVLERGALSAPAE